MLDYHRVYITPKERDWLTRYGRPDLPTSFRTLADVPETDVFTVSGKRVGILLFPVPGDFFKASREDVQAVVHAAEALRPQVDLLVGLSSWGRTNEELYLEHAPPVLDILLGSGPGQGMRGRIVGQGATYWVRSLTNGKYMLTLDIRAWPGPERRWKNPETISETFRELDVRIPDDPAIRALFRDK
jgi:hypothetical protein